MNSDKVTTWMHYERLMLKGLLLLYGVGLLIFGLVMTLGEYVREYVILFIYPTLALWAFSVILFIVSLLRFFKFLILRNKDYSELSMWRTILALLLSPVAFAGYYILFFIIGIQSCSVN
jgi:membrane-bound ClpP family serine protease